MHMLGAYEVMRWLCNAALLLRTLAVGSTPRILLITRLG
jgi:hypothetical protein